MTKSSNYIILKALLLNKLQMWLMICLNFLLFLSFIFLRPRNFKQRL